MYHNGEKNSRRLSQSFECLWLRDRVQTIEKKCEVWQLEKKFDSADETEEIFFKPLKGLTSRLRMYPFLLTVRTLFKYS